MHYSWGLRRTSPDSLYVRILALGNKNSHHLVVELSLKDAWHYYQEICFAATDEERRKFMDQPVTPKLIVAIITAAKALAWNTDGPFCESFFTWKENALHPVPDFLRLKDAT